ncbi:DUF892 family protein [Pedobacter lusitanus]|uniref:DUF892 family protein n=1 Tax=Pedobacter lusitanus TaxID=1503925 RepID=UPI000697E954|nr:DUF892 family protein [Pedobacter lusitanus]
MTTAFSPGIDPLTGLPDSYTDHSISREQSDKTKKTTQFHQLFVEELQDMLWADEHLLKLLRELEKAAENSSLKTMLNKHLTQTVIHVQRLREMFEKLKQQPKLEKCQGMAGLIAEAELLVEHTDRNPLVRDAAIIMAMQKINQYEMASYETMVTFAEQWGHFSIKELLLATLKEKWQTDTELANIAVIVMAP